MVSDALQLSIKLCLSPKSETQDHNSDDQLQNFDLKSVLKVSEREKYYHVQLSSQLFFPSYLSLPYCQGLERK